MKQTKKQYKQTKIFKKKKKNHSINTKDRITNYSFEENV